MRAVVVITGKVNHKAKSLGLISPPRGRALSRKTGEGKRRLEDKNESACRDEKTADDELPAHRLA